MSERTFFQPIYIGKETTKGTAVTPTVAVPCYSETLTTDTAPASDEPAFGRRLKRFQTLPGNRNHKGALKVMAEPNSAARFIDMVATKLSTSGGSDPYTHTHGESITTDPNSYTVDIVKGLYTVRFAGVEASKFMLGFEGDGKMTFDLDVSGLSSFYPREISSVSGSGPYTVVLKTDYDASPTTGLVASDAIKFYDVSAGTYITATIASIVDGTSFTTSTNPSAITAGDMMMLAPQTPSFALLTPFLKGKTQFFFSTDAATALTASATASNQTRLEPNTTISLMNPFSKDTGENRTGSFDPVSLPREGGYDVEFAPEVFLDTPEKGREWASLAKTAMVMRSYQGATNQHELRVTLNNLKNTSNDTSGTAGKVLYHKFKYNIDWDSTDTQAFSFITKNAVSTI